MQGESARRKLIGKAIINRHYMNFISKARCGLRGRQPMREEIATFTQKIQNHLFFQNRPRSLDLKWKRIIMKL
ncbi:hypothetical protein [Candidatus Ponderosibacter sp. Uisw_141_02]|uniref:hypothetical protein n=1 Tax=Candidatus Ponderosibacter sp. Uisw_141_02 TaxID=3231000 RepID=UPI003D519A24